MATRVYVFHVKLSGWRGVQRTIAIDSTATLADLHHALQRTFAWEDEHLYAFWRGRKFWPANKTAYVHPLALEADSVAHGGPAAGGRRKSAERRRLDRLRLSEGQRIAYLFDFGAQWRVRLTLHEIVAGDGGQYPRILDFAGDAPPPDAGYDELPRAA
jgi:Plasmid pRiA4b ORF-3-like protein